MGVPPKNRVGNFSALARVVQSLPASKGDSVAQKRKMVADFCRLIGAQFSAPPVDPTADLAPRHAQTLQRLLMGDSEKQIATHLKVSRHTVHVYITAIYRHYRVNSRGELLALFVQKPDRMKVPLVKAAKAPKKPKLGNNSSSDEGKIS